MHLVAFLGAADIKTVEEVRYPCAIAENEDIARFLSRLQSQSEVVKVRLVGRTKEVDDYASKDLYLCLLTEEGAAEPQPPNRQKPTILYIASQHGNEQSVGCRSSLASDQRPLLATVKAASQKGKYTGRAAGQSLRQF